MIGKLTGEGGDEDDVKKIIDIFKYKHRLLSIDMKTKVVQHGPMIIFNVFRISNFQVFKVFRFPAPF